MKILVFETRLICKYALLSVFTIDSTVDKCNRTESHKSVCADFEQVMYVLAFTCFLQQQLNRAKKSLFRFVVLVDHHNILYVVKLFTVLMVRVLLFFVNTVQKWIDSVQK